MERKIGEKFEFNGAWYVVEKQHTYGDCCTGCVFQGSPGCCFSRERRGSCAGVIFARCEPPATEEKKKNTELTKREKIALAVLQALIASPRPLNIENNAAIQTDFAFVYADNFLKKASE